MIKNELQELKDKYSDKRRTDIIEDFVDNVIAEDLIKDENVAITITHSGYIKRMPLNLYKSQHRGGKGIIATTTREEDVVKDIFIASTHDYILFFTNEGKVYWLKVHQIPESSRITKGKAIINLVELGKGERITAFVPVRNFDKNHYLIMVTKKGIVKKTSVSSFRNPRRTGIIAITLDQGDELINVELTDGQKDIIIATKKGLAVRFEENKIRPSGRSSQGAKGVSLKEGDLVAAMIAAEKGQSLLTITENGFGKRTSVDEYRLTNRGGSGVINIKTSERNSDVVSIISINNQDEVIFISKNGIVIRMPASEISNIGRNTLGVRLMRLEKEDKVVSATVVKGNKNN